MSTNQTTASDLAREPWTSVISPAVHLPLDDVDTDQIIPARFLTTTQRAGLGKNAFADWRYDASGRPIAEFPFNAPESAGRQILVAGANFGCGSSREHAPWALIDAGFRAIVAASFADIFRSNANRNGLLTVAIGDSINTLNRQMTAQPDTLVSIDLATQRISWDANEAVAFHIDAFTKRALLSGLDELGMLVDELPSIVEWERQTGRNREGRA